MDNQRIIFDSFFISQLCPFDWMPLINLKNREKGAYFAFIEPWYRWMKHLLKLWERENARLVQLSHSICLCSWTIHFKVKINPTNPCVFLKLLCLFVMVLLQHFERNGNNGHVCNWLTLLISYTLSGFSEDESDWLLAFTLCHYPVYSC